MEIMEERNHALSSWGKRGKGKGRRIFRRRSISIGVLMFDNRIIGRGGAMFRHDVIKRYKRIESLRQSIISLFVYWNERL